jgi:hypothetical protein
MNKLTVQINNLEALERLIGGDTEVEIDIRKSVVENFVKKHLKGIANDTLVKQAEKNIQQYVSNLLLEEIKGHWRPEKAVLTDTAKNLLRDFAKDMMDTELRQLVLDQIGSSTIIKTINDLLERQANFIAAQLSDDVLKERLDAMVNKRLKEKLGIS